MRRVVIVLALAAALGAPQAASAADPATSTPIRHFITLMQENHSFDNYFGTYPGADGIPAGTCMPKNVDRPKAGCVKPFHIGNRAVKDLGHSEPVFTGQQRGGRMDGFVDVFRRQGIDGSTAMGYYDDRDLPFYWNIADEYVLFDRFFTSAGAGSVINHMYWIAGVPGTDGEDSIPKEGFRVPTIFDRLEAKGISWKFYVQNYDPSVTFRTLDASDKAGDKGSQVVWVPLLAYPRFLDDPDLFGHIVPLDELYDDLTRGTLPAVSYIVPSGASEHPPGSIQAGERFVRTLINALMRSEAWSSSAFHWTYDDWGGWYDHVEPPRVDRFGYGPRAPALLVSPYARRGRIDSTELDFTSVLKFIEQNWGLKPLGRRDARANSLMGAFDFDAPPRPAKFVPVERGTVHGPEPRRPVIYAMYGSALAMALGLVAWPALLRRRQRGPAALLLLGALALGQPHGAEAAGPQIQFATVPPVPGLRVTLEGHTAVANSAGVVRIARPATAELTFPRFLEGGGLPAGVRATFGRWYGHPFTDRRARAAIDLHYQVRIRFVDLAGNPVPLQEIDSVKLRGSTGFSNTFRGEAVREPLWLQGSRIVSTRSGPMKRELYYTVDEVIVRGSNVVNRGQQKFFAARTRQTAIQLLFYPATFTSRDLLFRFPIGKSIALTFPDGKTERYPLRDDATLTLPSLPRGEYGVRVEGAPGISFQLPVALSKGQVTPLKIISWLDVALVVGLLGALAVGLPLARRPRLRALLTRGPRRLRRVLLAAALLTALPLAAPAGADAQNTNPERVLAYYYIWFEESSWNRAKNDYPVLGRYSSDERRVMSTHVRWAKKAGIDGFIVSWKSTPKLDKRLERLIEISARERFKLSVIYQGLDFYREPLPVERVAHDLELFANTYASSPVFNMFQRPVVIWSGSWRFSRAEIDRVTRPLRDRLLVLASEKNLDGYRRVAPFVDGNAYYWSSVNPHTQPDYGEKLDAMGREIHERGGLWLAPAAAGFDARLIGGTRVVGRALGETLRIQLRVAAASSPDAIGLISWNEFSENSQVEPSVRFGWRALQVLGDVLGASFRPKGDFASDEAPEQRLGYGLPFLIGLGGVVLAGLGVIVWRRELARAAPAGLAAGETPGHRIGDQQRGGGDDGTED